MPIAGAKAHRPGGGRLYDGGAWNGFDFGFFIRCSLHRKYRSRTGTRGPATTYLSVPETGKWILIFCMLLGRLEIYTVILLLTPEYWRKQDKKEGPVPAPPSNKSCL